MITPDMLEDWIRNHVKSQNLSWLGETFERFDKDGDPIEGTRCVGIDGYIDVIELANWINRNQDKDSDNDYS